MTPTDRDRETARKICHAIAVRIDEVQGVITTVPFDAGIPIIHAALANARASAVEPFTMPRRLDDWHDDDGPVLWWKFPVCEPPYVGGPTDCDWPGYHTHWTTIPMPRDPKEVACE